jgi:diadenosine tetraphosphate (Ap4A) HIT family hydrolase
VDLICGEIAATIQTTILDIQTIQLNSRKSQDIAIPGQVFVEARGHWLDLAAMPPEEATTYGLLLHQLSAAIKRATGAERVYVLTMIEDIPHFHVWLIPRQPEVAARGVAFLAEEHSCTEDEAVAAAEALRAALADGAGST